LEEQLLFSPCASTANTCDKQMGFTGNYFEHFEFNNAQIN
jgi:hypothetical protein